jgi:hypothetical protein
MKFLVFYSPDLVEPPEIPPHPSNMEHFDSIGLRNS